VVTVRGKQDYQIVPAYQERGEGQVRNDGKESGVDGAGEVDSSRVGVAPVPHADGAKMGTYTGKEVQFGVGIGRIS